MSGNDPRRLDDQERRLAELLRQRGQPSPALDARILAAAREATAGARAHGARRPRPRWVGGIAVAASLCLAVGLAWQLRPSLTPAPIASDAAAEMQAAPAEEPIAAFSAPEPVAAPAQPRVVPVPAPARQREAQAATVEPPPQAEAAIAQPDAPPVAPPAPAASAASAAAATPAAAAAQAANPAADTMLDRVTVTGSQAPAERTVAPVTSTPARPAAAPARSMAPPPPPQAPAAFPAQARPVTSAPAAATAGSEAIPKTTATPRAATAESAARNSVAPQDEDDVPPVTADDPVVREAWLRNILDLQAAGATESARISLRQFRLRYPDHPLPESLRKLGD